MQAVLGGLNLSDAEFKNGDTQPNLEAYSVFRHVNRIMKGLPVPTSIVYLDSWLHIAVVEVAIVKKSGAQIKHGLEM